MPAISVNIITKDQPQATIRCVESVYEHLYKSGDEIVIVDTGSSEDNFDALRLAADKFEGCRIISKPHLSENLAPYIEKWLPDHIGEIEKDAQYESLTGLLSFADARNVARAYSRKPVIFWIDSDDILVDETGGRLREIVDETMDPDNPKLDAVFLDYDYAHAEDGSVTTRLKRERFFFRERYYWKGHCHETAIPVPGVEARGVGYYEGMPARIVHTEARKTSGVSDIRNYIILRKALDEEVKNDDIDPRTIFYLGNAARGLKRHAEAIGLYKQFEAQSGSRDDRYAACSYIAGTYMLPCYKRPLEAIDWFTKCTEINPSDPRAFFGISRAYAALCRWKECLQWYEFGRALPAPDRSLHSVDPTQINYHPHLIAALASRELGDAKKACEYTSIAYQARPNFPEAQQQMEGAQQAGVGQHLTEAVTTVLRNVQDRPKAKGLAKAIVKALPAVPHTLEKQGIGKVEPADPREERTSLAIVCGPTPEPWGPENAKTGIGGSEKMVILLAAELQNRGVNVSVYAEIPFSQRGVAETGVRWQHWSELDETVERDAVIYWRNHSLILGTQIPAKKRFMWLHDVQTPGRYTPEILAVLDEVQFQSYFHRGPVADVVPLEKSWVSNNAIVPDLYDSEKSDPCNVLYCSSPDRGLLTSLLIYERAKTLAPDLPWSMDIAYGWNQYARKASAEHNHRYIPDLGRDAALDDYERLINRMIDKVDAKMHNRVSFDEIAALQNKAGIWLYPTRFEEISCMVAMETQAAGCIPVATRYGALDETIFQNQKYGLPPVPPGPVTAEYIDQAAQILVDAAREGKSPFDREVDGKLAKDKFSIAKLADEWMKRLV